MDAWELLCPGCFAEKGAVSVCPYCGYDESVRRTPLVMPHRSVLNGQFVVGKVLGKPGGFGITYLGWDINLATLVAIKEYLPRDYAGRDADRVSVMAHSHEDASLFRFGLEQFLQEARTLARFDHPNVVRVRSFFEQNGTAYLVMDYLQGVNLSEHLANNGGRLTEKQAGEIMLPILDGLQEVHAKGFLHRDIKPQNIYITTGGRPILLDFGAARQAMGERSRSLSVVLTPGFSPYEQYHRRGEQGPWTDIYALAATYYYLLCGQSPPDAPERVAVDELVPLAKLLPDISQSLNDAIMQALRLEATERPQDVFLFRDLLTGKTAVSSTSNAIQTVGSGVKEVVPPPLPPIAESKPIIVASAPPNQAFQYAGSAPAPYSPPFQGAVSGQAPNMQNPIPRSHPAQHPGFIPPPPASTGKSGSGLWIAMIGIVVVVIAAGWYFLVGINPKDSKDPVTATPPPKTSSPDPQTIKPDDKQPFEPLPAAKTPTPPNQPSSPSRSAPMDPGTKSEQAKPPTDDSPKVNPPLPPRQQPAVRPQPPVSKPTAPTPPQREQGSLW